MCKYKELYFEELGDDRGHLVVVEGMNNIPFEIQRIFYIYGTKSGVIRGQHANRNSEFVLINVSGKSKVLIDDGNEKAVIHLDEPRKGVYINKLVWKDMYDFSEDSILLVLSSEKYDGAEYIRNYEDFIHEVKKGAVEN
jgi:dTDP-4-dehydrorhamnose 3,5-epimerase-like enzyme